MKVIISTLIFSVVLAGIPAKVWACGLGLCDMEHSKGKNDPKKPSCHSTDHDEQSKVAGNKVDGPSVKPDPQVCPCPSKLPVFAFVRILEPKENKIETSKSTHAARVMPSIGYELGLNWSRPPPTYSIPVALSGRRLLLNIQIFLI